LAAEEQVSPGVNHSGDAKQSMCRTNSIGDEKSDLISKKAAGGQDHVKGRFFSIGHLGFIKASRCVPTAGSRL
jgi:aspartate aminotransferase-like enzyme